MSDDSTNQMIAALSLQVQHLSSEIAHLRDIVSGTPSLAEGWAKPTDAAPALRSGGVQSPRHLQRLRLDGAFAEGRDIRNVSKGDGRPTWEYHIPNCRKALERHFRKRVG